MENTGPLVSIIVPCFNQGSFLGHALTSVLEQTYFNWECIIVNDGSNDNTEQVALNFCKKDHRFQYHKKPNGGLSSARNAGIELAQGELIQFLDSDDWIHQHKLAASVEQFANRQVDLIVSNFNVFDSISRRIKPPYSDLSKINIDYKSLLLHWDIYYSIPIHTGIFKSSFFHGFRFDVDLKAKEDWLMWLHILAISEKVGFINKPYATYRVHYRGMTRDKLSMLHNSAVAFQKIYAGLTDQRLKQRFMKRTNDFWLTEYQRLIYESSVLYKIKTIIKYIPGFYTIERLMLILKQQHTNN